MTKQVQRRRGTATQHTSFTGAEGEISVNTTNKSAHVHDGVTAGGFELARKDLNNVTTSSVASKVSGGTISTIDINGGTIDGTVIGGATPAAGSFTTASTTGDLTIADKIVHSGDTNTSIRFPAADTVTVETSGAERLRITSTGNVGIGTTAPSQPLTIQAAVPIIQLVDSNQTTRVANIGGDNGNVTIDIDPAQTAAANFFSVDIDDTERFRITAAGNVGIGTTSPTGDLTIGGSAPRLDFLETSGSAGFDNTVLIRDADVFSIQTRNGGTFVSNDYRITTDASGALTHEWRIGNTERMRIDASGNVGIGTSSPSHRLDVSGGDIRLGTNATYIRSVSSGGSNVRMLGINASDTAYVGPIDSGPISTIFNASSSATVAAFYTGGAERMRIDASGNVGIGTSSPSSYNGTASTRVLAVGTTSGNNGVNVISGTTSTGSYLFSDSGGNDRGGLIYYHTADTMTMLTAGTERMRIDSSGNVGLGTIPTTGWSTGTALEIGSSATVRGLAIWNPNSSGGSYLLANAYGDGAGAFLYGAARPATRYDLFDGAHKFYTAPSGTAGTAISFTERMRIDPSGNVGIGTSTPSQPLDVATARFSNVIIGTNATDTNKRLAIFYDSVTPAAVIDATQNILSLRTIGVERMRIDSSGNVGIGTSSPAVRLHVDGGDGNHIRYSGATNSVAMGMTGVNPFIGSLTSAPLLFLTGGTERARIDASGNLLVNKTTATTTGAGHYLTADGAAGHTRASNPSLAIRRDTTDGQCAIFLRDGTQVGSISVTTTATAYNTSSDYRLKEDVQPMVGASDRVLALNPVNFAWKADGSRTDGFIAHEVQEVAPYAVLGEKDGEEMQAMDHSKLVPLLTAALQEALTKIEVLEARLAAANL